VFVAPGEVVDLAGGAAGTSGLRVSVSDIEATLGPWRTLPLYGPAVSDLGPQALTAGFHEADHIYVYSRVPEDGWCVLCTCPLLVRTSVLCACTPLVYQGAVLCVCLVNCALYVVRCL
jgi:hypothetical protein